MLGPYFYSGSIGDGVAEMVLASASHHAQHARFLATLNGALARIEAGKARMVRIINEHYRVSEPENATAFLRHVRDAYVALHAAK